MRDTKLYEQLLGLERPWSVRAVTLKLEEELVEVEVECSNRDWVCPECGKRMHLHGSERRKWRHLDSCQFKTILVADVPRAKCPEHGTTAVKVPWAEKHSRFTAMFERLAIDVMRHCSIEAARKYLRLSWDEADGIKAKAVERGLRRKGVVEATAICIDEKSVGRGHDYVSVVMKLAEQGPIVDFIGDGRSEESLEGFWQAQTPEVLGKIRCASMDMWQPYINSVEANLPAGKKAISHDPFHVVLNMNKALDQVRRQEVAWSPAKDREQLKGTRHMWLYGFENLPEKWEERLEELKDSTMKTARAWRLKELLRAMYRCETWTEAEAFYQDWNRDAMRSKLEPVKKVARMIKDHLAEVLNFFIHRITNAYSEGNNSMIQALIKRANGYRNRERLKRDLYFHLGGLDLYPELAL
jgi:transposase